MHKYENRAMKCVEIVLRSGEKGMRKSDRGVNLIRVLCMLFGNITTKSLCTTNVCQQNI
jgi:hypothetical protein